MIRGIKIILGLSGAAFITLFIAPFIGRGAEWYFDAKALGQSGQKQIEICSYQAVAMGTVGVPCGQTTQLQQEQAVSIGQEIAVELHGSKSHQVAQLELVSGEKSIIAGRGVFMSMALLQSKAGQTVDDGTKVHFLYQGKIVQEAVTRGGIAHVLHKAPRYSGAVEALAHSGGINAIANSIRVVPADPVTLSFRRSNGLQATVADHEVWVESTVLKDHFGNTLSDGSLVQFVGQDSQNRKVLLHAVSVNGVATAKLVNRHLTEKISLYASQKDVRGQSQTLLFDQGGVAPQLTVQYTMQDGQVDIKLGPILRQTGGFVPDGTVFHVRTKDKRVLKASSMEGFVAFRFTQQEADQDDNIIIESKGLKWRAKLVSEKAFQATDQLGQYGQGDALKTARVNGK